MVLKPNSSVLEAARAIEQNRIGAVVVQHKGRVVGIVTDRDLAVRALGRALDPKTTTIDEVMTPDPLTLTPADSQADAIRLMQTRNVRRIPLVEEERVVGMVTLDDLLIDEGAPLEELAAVVQAQIGEGGPAQSDRLPSRRRRLARAEGTLGRLVNKVREEADLESAEQARGALEVVLASLVRRLNEAEAEHLIAQLPSLLQAPLRRLPPGPDKSVTRESIESELAARLDLDRGRAGQLLAAVAATLAQWISPGQMEDVRGQLPPELREVFPASAPAAHA
ncbi:MAG TPA: CBS domain-containing protein [Gammaproteobacteria bacterium]